MFGGWAWLLNSHLQCGARDDGMLVRLGKGNDGWALERQDVSPMRSRERVMHGWIRCGPLSFGDDTQRRKLLSHALEFVRSLPAK